MTDKELADQLKEFVEDFEKNMERNLKKKGDPKLTWIHESELDADGVTPHGDCASQAGCGGIRCKDKIDLCIVRYCRRLHNCKSRCQVATDCKVKYCHGRDL